MIEFKNVSKSYRNGTLALDNVSMKIEQGEFVFIVGDSGAGKSTLLKIIMREEVATEGTVVIKNRLLNTMKKRDIPYFRRHLGIVFQDFRLIPNMTVYDNVAFAMRVIGAKEKRIGKRVPYVLSLVGLGEKSKCMPNELSGGEQQRVALARAIVNNADIIIADEPTGNIDAKRSCEVVEMLEKINATGTTVIMVTHSEDLVRRYGRRIITIEGGKIKSDDISRVGQKRENYVLPDLDIGSRRAAREVDEFIRSYHSERTETYSSDRTEVLEADYAESLEADPAEAYGADPIETSGGENDEP